MSEFFEQISQWLNANEGVLEGVAVLIAVLTIAAPRLRSVFRSGDASGAQAIYDPDTMALHPAFLAALTDAQKKGVISKDKASKKADSFFAPRLGKRKAAYKNAAKAATVERAEYEHPTVAVFAFDCLNGGENLQGLSAAFNEEITIGLSSLIGYDIMAGRITSGYEQHVSKLGARYLIEGSIREVSDLVRMIVRLVDVESGRHIWAERYECNCDEIDAREDEFTNQIVSGLTSALQQSEADRAADADPDALDAWSLTMLAFSGVVAGGTGSDGAEQAVEFARRAVAQDPSSGYAHAVQAAALMQLASFDGPMKDKVSMDEVADLARKGLELAPRDSTVLALTGFVKTNLGQNEEAIGLLEQAVSLNPYNARGLASLGRALRNADRCLDAIPKFERALAIAPNDNMAFLWASWLASSFAVTGQLTEAVEAARRAIDMNRNYFWPWLVMTACLAQLGRMVEAADAYAEFELYRGTLDEDGIKTLVRESLGQQVDITVFMDGVRAAQNYARGRNIDAAQ